MSNIPQVSGQEVIKALTKIGFSEARQKGSHIRLVRIKENGFKQLITVPNHKLIRRGTLLNGILKPINLPLEEFKKLLK
ncbi:MAG: type II toxin-antitoxin system HicA family toxin [Candidatus Daviesbacteria bacterium]|nr:type II toxin-antitoxin system HicA family toxin [Candidatus Daviesbacteria bacterium]